MKKWVIFITLIALLLGGCGGRRNSYSYSGSYGGSYSRYSPSPCISCGTSGVCGQCDGTGRYAYHNSWESDRCKLCEGTGNCRGCGGTGYYG